MESTLIATPRVFVDSSVLIAAVLSTTGSAQDLVRIGVKGMATLVISPLVVTEVELNLLRKAPAKLPYLRQLLGSSQLEVIEPPIELVASEAMSVEPKDAAIVAAAVAGDVQFLVTYDVKHLLRQAVEIEARHGILVCPPAVVISSVLDAA